MTGSSAARRPAAAGVSLLRLPLLRPRGAARSVALLAALTAASGCSLPPPPTEPPSPAAADVPEPPAASPAGPARAAPADTVTHGSVSRARAEQLDDVVGSILEVTKPALVGVRAELDHAVAALPVPEQLTTNSIELRGWHAERREAYEARVDELYDQAEEQLRRLAEFALATASRQAQRLAPSPSPLDQGATGDPELDKRLTALEEFLRGKAALSDLEAAREQDKQRRVELVEAFSSFGAEGADAALDGRIFLFVGAGPAADRPRCMFAYRHDGAGAAGEHRIAQVMRHRVLRGATIVHDGAWRPAPGHAVPGFPDTEVFGHYLVAPRLDPIVRDDERLRDMRVVIDVQTAVVGPAGEVLGGVDWRLEFSISTRGDVTWELAEHGPVYDPWCSEVERVLGS